MIGATFWRKRISKTQTFFLLSCCYGGDCCCCARCRTQGLLYVRQVLLCCRVLCLVIRICFQIATFPIHKDRRAFFSIFLCRTWRGFHFSMSKSRVRWVWVFLPPQFSSALGNLSCSISVGVGEGDWRVPALMLMSTIGYLQPSYEVAQCGHGSCVPLLIWW